jgi:hypothetical protein
MKADVRLTAKQYKLIERHAAALPSLERDTFKHGVVSRLCGEPSDHAVSIACNLVMDARPAFMCAVSSETTERS